MGKRREARIAEYRIESGVEEARLAALSAHECADEAIKERVRANGEAMAPAALCVMASANFLATMAVAKALLEAQEPRT